MRKISLAQLVAAGVVINRLRHGMDRRPPVAASDSDISCVSVVIPARNEAARIRECLESLEAHGGVGEIIVVNDHSTDDTAKIARAHGAQVLDAAALPDGWIGKPWALQQGLQAAQNDIVVCLDADVAVQPGAMSALVDQLKSNDFVTLSARLRTPSAMAQALSASMLSTLVYRFGPVGQRRPQEAGRTMANGQCMAFRREQLLSVRGFELSASNMTDDIALARALTRRRWRVAFLDGSDLVDVEMYSSADELWREWPRSLPMNDVTTAEARLLDTVLLWLTMGLPWLRLLSGRATLVDRALIVQRFALGAAFRKAFHRPSIGLALSPLVDVPVLARLTWTTIRPVRRWRERDYRQ